MNGDTEPSEWCCAAHVPAYRRNSRVLPLKSFQVKGTDVKPHGGAVVRLFDFIRKPRCEGECSRLGPCKARRRSFRGDMVSRFASGVGGSRHRTTRYYELVTRLHVVYVHVGRMAAVVWAGVRAIASVTKS